MNKNKNKDRRNIGIYYKINIKYMVEIVVSNNNFLSV